MFNNIGGKIKALAEVECGLGISISVIGGIILIGRGMESNSGEILVIIGVTTLILGPLSSWLGSFVLYGFGELIETNAEIARNSIKGTTSDSLTSRMVNDEKGATSDSLTSRIVNDEKGATSDSLTSRMVNDEKMKSLIEWKDNKLISEEEFEIKKQALLRGE